MRARAIVISLVAGAVIAPLQRVAADPPSATANPAAPATSAPATSASTPPASPGNSRTAAASPAPPASPAQAPAAATQTPPQGSNGGPLIYPAKGQSTETQKKDMNECAGWAKDTTGVDPVALAQASAQSPQHSSGGAPVAGGAAKGALAGAAVGAIAGDAGKGAAVGAATGGVTGGVRNRRGREKEAAQNQEAANKTQSELATYQRAYSACLEGRGYTVK